MSRDYVSYLFKYSIPFYIILTKWDAQEPIPTIDMWWSIMCSKIIKKCGNILVDILEVHQRLHL